MQFLDVLIRQAHPGPAVPPYRTFEQKLEDARLFKALDALPWPMLVDDLAGTVHQVYGGLADPTYLIDADGKVAYYNMWTYAPNLYEAMESLQGQGWRGEVAGGIDHVPHLSAALAHGWRGIRRGLPQSYTDLELAGPGSGILLWLGYQMRALLEPLVIRARPLPASTRAMLWGAVALLAIVAVRAWRRR